MSLTACVNPLSVPWRCVKCNAQGVLTRTASQSCDIDWEQIEEEHRKLSEFCDEEYSSFQITVGESIQ